MRVLAKIFYRGATWGKVSYQCPTLMAETSPMILITGLRFDNIRLICRSARDNWFSSMAYGLSIVNLAVQDGCYMWSVSQKQLVLSSTVVQILGITLTETNEQTEPRYFASAKNVIVQSQYPSMSAGIQWINDATTVTINVNDVPINTMSVTLCDWKTGEQSVISIHCLGIFSSPVPHGECMHIIYILYMYVCKVAWYINSLRPSDAYMR